MLVICITLGESEPSIPEGGSVMLLTVVFAVSMVAFVALATVVTIYIRSRRAHLRHFNNVIDA